MRLTRILNSIIIILQANNNLTNGVFTMSKLNKFLIVTLILVGSCSALAWVGHNNQDAMEACQVIHSYDYCFRQIMR